MIELVFTACSIVTGAQCRDVTLTFSDVSLMTCMITGQQPIAQWQAQHPNFTTGRYTCRVAGQFAKI